MEKRYQVFVSSTYADLKNERSRVIQTLMEMDCIPSGMELFPASDEEQWEFIKRIIDDCDYYLLIIGGKYGKPGPDGLSYTEKEYDYAVEKGLKIIALLHENPDDLPKTKIESNPEFKQKLIQFREKVATGRLVKFWIKSEDLPGIVSLSVAKTIKSFPATGWVRANQVSNEELLSEINELRKENSALKTHIQKYEKETIPSTENLANIEDSIKIKVRYYSYNQKSYIDKGVDITWKEIFSLISPFLLKLPNESYVQTIMGRDILKGYGGSIYDQDFQTIKIQLLSLKLVDVQYLKTVQGGMDWFWSLTPKGNKFMVELRSIKNSNINKDIK
jgi:hypothetical protein